jgi:hypothetical protein
MQRSFLNSLYYVAAILFATDLSAVSAIAGAQETDGRCSNRGRFDILLSLSIDRETALRMRQKAAKEIIANNMILFDESECRAAFQLWNRTISDADRLELLRPSKSELLKLVRSHSPNVPQSLYFEELLLCGLFGNSDKEWQQLLEQLSESPETGRSMFTRIAANVGMARAGNMEEQEKVEKCLSGESGKSEQLVTLNCALQVPVRNLQATAERLVKDNTSPLAVRLLALDIIINDSAQLISFRELIVAGMRDTQPGYFLSPYNISDDDTTCRMLAAGLILVHAETFSVADRRDFLAIVDTLKLDGRNSTELELLEKRLSE